MTRVMEKSNREVAAATQDLLILTPLTVERLALGGAAAEPGVHVMQTGMGPDRARAAAVAADQIDARAVAVVGFCGALGDDFRPGDLVVASEVRAPDGSSVPCSSAPLLAALRRLGAQRVHVGPIVSIDHIARGDERTELAATGAIAVDMESAWLADAARDRPLAVLRSVVDTPEHELRRVWSTAVNGITAYRNLRAATPALLSWGRATGPRTVFLAGPRSFCAGVERGIEIVERALDRYGPPIYVRKQIVHNVHVLKDLERRGARFVEELDEVPAGARVVFSAHGVSPQVRADANRRRLNVIDATCPLVTKVHAEARRFAKLGYHIVLVGHEGHEEVEGTMGEAPESIELITSRDDAQRVRVKRGQRVAYLTQTTLAVDEAAEVVQAVRRRYPTLDGPNSSDICYATSNRQEAVKTLARECDLLLVIGSHNSSNSQRLVEVAEREGCPARLIDDETGIDPDWLVGAARVGVTAGASAPEVLVQRVVGALASLGSVDVQERTIIEESLQFTLPIELR
ncbi:MAG TPA: 4-hydroxy-3-methylbut-2-enyl diphosphate reductase [Actinomycetota bacterium]|nr:4-hydroxy-3-methylbut-2-enyl diphosphate reductase [Actinomycetota bacterium]